MMARIGIVIYSLEGGGAERVAVNLAQALTARGHNLDFVLGKREGELLEALPACVNVFEGSKRSSAGWRDAIRQYASLSRPNVILAMMEGAGVLALQATKKVPVYVRSPIHYSLHYPYSESWKERYLLSWAVRLYFRRAACVIAPSNGVAKEICRVAWLKRDRARTMFSPVITPQFRQKVQEHVYHPWLAPDREWLTIISAGRLTAQKDYATLLRAVARVSARRSVRLLVLGQGEDRDALVAQCNKLQIGSYVEFLGFVQNPYPYMAAGDVFALASTREGIGNVLVEALAAGASVVSTDCQSGPREVLADGAFGELVPVGDDRELSYAIERATTRHVDSAALAAHLKQFESEHVADQYLRLFGLSST